jgi:hypothetical protein
MAPGKDRIQRLVAKQFASETAATITATSGFIGDLTGAVTGNVTGDTAGTHTGAVTGTAITATSLVVTKTGLHAVTGRVSKFVGTVAAPNHGDGYGAVEIDITASGTFAGMTAAASTWLNLAAASVPGGNLVAVRNDGIYVPSGITASSATMVIGGRLQYVADDGADPGALYLWSTNIYSNALTAMFHVNAKADLGWITGAASAGAAHIPLFRDVTAGQTWYVNVYTS